MEADRLKHAKVALDIKCKLQNRSWGWYNQSSMYAAIYVVSHSGSFEPLHQ